jgi:hypothetical protein
MPPPGSASAWETPAPVLLNTWKHHAAALRRRVRETIAGGPKALDALADQLVVIGTELMDLYHGAFTPAEIGAKVIAQLRAEGRLDRPEYRAWVEEQGGYGVLTFAEDASRWVVRYAAEDERYVHLHPARWAPRTCRVRANVLKTAILVLAYVGVHGGDPMDRAVVNAVRRDYLGLAPVGRDLSGEQGIGELIDLLKEK